MIEELVWVAGDTKHLLVILRSAPADTTHYYYFPGEYTPTKIVKWVDIEPLRKHVVQIGGKHSTIYLSRVHYWGLTIWINPTPKPGPSGDRPVCVFENNFHTPYLVYDHDPIVKVSRVGDVPRLRGLDWVEWHFASNYFVSKVHKVSASSYNGYPAVLGETKPEAVSDKRQLFDISSMLDATRYLVFVGLNSDVTSFESELTGGAGGLTKAALDQFLRNSE